MEYDDDECPFIPFSGEDVGIHDPTRTAPWIHDEDKIACILAVAIYGNPPPVIQSYELVIGTYKTRFAAWIDKQTRLLIVACRGTSIGMKGGFQDIKDDTVSFFILFFILQVFNPLAQVDNNCTETVVPVVTLIHNILQRFCGRFIHFLFFESRYFLIFILLVKAPKLSKLLWRR